EQQERPLAREFVAYQRERTNEAESGRQQGCRNGDEETSTQRLHSLLVFQHHRIPAGGEALERKAADRRLVEAHHHDQRDRQVDEAEGEDREADQGQAVGAREAHAAAWNSRRMSRKRLARTNVRRRLASRTIASAEPSGQLK